MLTGVYGAFFVKKCEIGGTLVLISILLLKK